ncbi:MAG: chemotaxis protein CheW [Proteocatella sp.]
MSEELFQFMNQEYEESEELQVDTKKYQKYLTFLSDGLLFGIDTNNIMEIITNLYPIKLPMVPNFVKGIINLRGQIVPIVDMRLRMGKSEIEYDDKSCIIVLNMDNIDMGIIVDSVEQVLDIEEERISSMLNKSEELVSGMISLPNQEAILILDCETIIKG